MTGHKMLRNAALLLATVATLGGCSKDTDSGATGVGLEAPEAVPSPAVGSVQSAGSAMPSPAPGPAAARNPHAAPNPHGAPAGQNPHAIPSGPPPHGGIDPAPAGTGTPVANPHSGLGQGEIDPARFLRGTLVGTAATAPLIKPGDIVFVSVKIVDPKTGQLGPTVAVDRYDVEKLPVTFSLDGSDVMTTAVPFSGKVAILARVDRDGEARTAMPGDIQGQVTATIPAEGLELALDQVIE